jgi:hypothetical protein
MLLLLCCLAILPAAEPVVCPGEPLTTAVARLAAAGLDPAEPDAGLLVEAATQPVVLALAGGDPAAARQALAHAAGAWLVQAADGHWICTRARHLPMGRAQVRVAPSALRDRLELEPVVVALMEPWIGSLGGVAYHPVDGSWTATLDAAGHAQLIAVLTACERPVPWAPHRQREPAPAGGGGPLPAGPWSASAAALAASWGVAVSIAPGTPALAPALPACRAADLPDMLAGSGLAAAWIQGVLCVGPQAPGDRRHPGLRRQLAQIPIPHLAADPAAASALAHRLREENPARWSQPGFAIVPLGTGLLVAGDADAIHAVLDALVRMDAGGG